MSQTLTQNYIRIPKAEYLKLKQLQKYFGSFWNYFEHLQDINEARKDIKEGKIIVQKELFKELDI